jgi:pSer/pThr/pTyr-binding forkhead associated (FHA) protein
LVSHDDEMGIPRVAPFIVDMPGAQAPEDESRSERVLILKVRNLSATYPLVNDVTTMGRPDAETQSYPDVEIELDDSVSRKHAEIRRKAVEFYLVDLGSTNGTMLNGQPLRPVIENQLKHGDRIRMGEKTELVFE